MKPFYFGHDTLHFYYIFVFCKKGNYKSNIKTNKNICERQKITKNKTSDICLN